MKKYVLKNILAPILVIAGIIYLMAILATDNSQLLGGVLSALLTVFTWWLIMGVIGFFAKKTGEVTPSRVAPKSTSRIVLVIIGLLFFIVVWFFLAN